MRLSHGQALAEAGLGPRNIVLGHGQQPEPEQCIAPQQRRGFAVPRQCLLQPGPPLLVRAAKEPEDREGTGEPQERLRFTRVREPVQGRPQVVVVGLQPIEPVCLTRPDQLQPHRPDAAGGCRHRSPCRRAPVGRLGERHEERRVPAVNDVALIRRIQAIARVLADGLQHGVARLVAGRGALPQQTVVDQGGDPVHHVKWGRRLDARRRRPSRQSRSLRRRRA